MTGPGKTDPPVPADEPGAGTPGEDDEAAAEAAARAHAEWAAADALLEGQPTELGE